MVGVSPSSSEAEALQTSVVELVTPVPGVYTTLTLPAAAFP